MLRPICCIGRTVSSHQKVFKRNKVIETPSILNKVQKLKLWHKENKELFGPLLESNKQKKQRLQKTVKNSRAVHQNKTAAECVKKDVLKSQVYDEIFARLSPLSVLRTKMWSNTRTCVSFVWQNNTVRGFKTVAASSSARSSPAQPGYASEDKILQIKQHQNDYAKQYPSVTLILNKTMTEDSQIALEKWKQERIAEMGQEEFNRFYEAQMAVGTKFHSTLKGYFTQPRTQLRIEKEVEGVWNSVTDVLQKISSPKAIESNVVHPVLKYRGIFDALADYEDKPTLIEWKKSDKPRKTIALTYDNPVQLAAYFGAVCNDLNYKHFNVRDALLVIGYTDGSKADTYRLTTDNLREHWAQWLIRLENYIKKHGSEPEKILKGGKRLFEEDIGNLQ